MNTFVLPHSQNKNENTTPNGVLLGNLITGSQNTLLSISSVFPFDLFPDTLTIDENKVNIIHRDSFLTTYVHSALIEDITEVSVDRNPFLATLRITDSNNSRFPLLLTIRKLRVKDADLARRVIQGLISANREGVELTKLNKKALLNELESIGKMKGVE